MAASSSEAAPTMGKGPGVSTWAQLFDVPQENRMQFRSPERVNDGFRLPREVKKKGEERWRDCLIGQFVGAQPNVAQLQSWATAIWGRDGAVRVSRFGARMFVFQFPSSSTSKWVFRTGPWHFQGNQLYLRKWSPGIQPVNLLVETLPIWVSIWGIPLEYHSTEGLEWIASTVGPPLWMDKTTRVGGKLGFAKVCVDLSADCGFPAKVRLYPDDDPFFEVTVEYLNLPRVCSQCQVYGHDCKSLADSNKKWVVKGTVQQGEVKGPNAEMRKVESVQSAEGNSTVAQVEEVLQEGVTSKADATKSKGKEVEFQDPNGCVGPTPLINGGTAVSFVEVVSGSPALSGSSDQPIHSSVGAASPNDGRASPQMAVAEKEPNP
ncbi:unnamed protein product [Linum trigynum]|uniref:DUF4283 domain-containing protein n=1 Tax=Linum trigynum TaxID=586398 RepID=A0AAV2G9N4_9ROSI